MNNFYSLNSLSEILSSAFDQRKIKNSSYSLRAFARDLDLSVSRLSVLIKGGHGVGGSTAENLAQKLKLKPQEKKYFFDIILAESARNKKVRLLANQRIEKARKTKMLLQIQEEQFKIISDWHHAAILELTQIEGFEQSPEWIAKKLGIPLEQAHESIARLKKINLIQIDKDKKWQINPQAYQTFSKSSVAVKKFHHQILEMAQESILNDPTELRECQAMILAIPQKDLSKFSDLMRDFLRECWENLGDTPKDSLYSLSVQLTPVGSKKGKH